MVSYSAVSPCNFFFYHARNFCTFSKVTHYKSKKQTWALCHEACEEMRENEINTRNKAGFGYTEYDASLKFLSGDTKWIIYTYMYLYIYKLREIWMEHAKFGHHIGKGRK